jgi:hypothetical protein
MAAKESRLYVALIGGRRVAGIHLSFHAAMS